MTSIICWENEQSLWVVSDSRINQNSDSVLNDLSPKIFQLPIKVGFNEDPFLAPIQIASIGFAFSGSTLIANITKDLLQLLLSNLKSMQYEKNGFSTETAIQEQILNQIKKNQKPKFSNEIRQILSSKLIEKNHNILEKKPVV